MVTTYGNYSLSNSLVFNFVNLSAALILLNITFLCPKLHYSVLFPWKGLTLSFGREHWWEMEPGLLTQTSGPSGTMPADGLGCPVTSLSLFPVDTWSSCCDCLLADPGHQGPNTGFSFPQVWKIWWWWLPVLAQSSLSQPKSPLRTWCLVPGAHLAVGVVCQE